MDGEYIGMEKQRRVRCELRGILYSRGIKATWLSGKAEVPYASLYRFINGERMPDVDVAVAIARALDLSVEDIWVWEDNAK
jgi:predicted transcriptional regulator